MKNTQISASSSNDDSRTKLAKFAKYTIKSGLYGVLLAGTLGAAALSAMNELDSEKTYRDAVRSIVGEACMPKGAYPGYYLLQGDAINIAAGMLLKHPKETQKVCSAITASLAISESEPINQVYVLANVLGVTPQVADEAIAQDEFDRAVKARKAGLEKTYTNPDVSSGLSM